MQFTLRYGSKQNNQNIGLINDSRTAWPTSNFRASFEFLGQCTIQCMYVLFFKKAFLRLSTKHGNFWLAMQYPLKFVNVKHSSLYTSVKRHHSFNAYSHCSFHWWVTLAPHTLLCDCHNSTLITSAVDKWFRLGTITKICE